MEKFRLKILTPEGTVMDKDVAGLYLQSADGFDDVEGIISEGMLRVTSKEVLLMVRSWE